MSSPEQERMDVISTSLANILRNQQELDRRLRRIEESLHLSLLEPEAIPVNAAETAVPQAPPPTREEIGPVASHPEMAGIQTPPPPPPPRAALETSIGLTVLNRVGVITLVLGMGFLFKWAVDNQWIGPAGRAMLGVLAGFAVLAGADFLWRRGQRIFAQGITATGICILYLAIYAAFGFYHLIPQGFAFVLMAFTTAMAGALSMRYGALAIAALGLIGGYLTPLMLSTGEKRPWFLFGYLLLLDLAAFALAKARAWRPLEVLSFAGTTIIFGAWVSNFKTEDQFVGTFYLLVFYTLFALTSMQPLFLILQFAATTALVNIWWGEPSPAYLALTFLLVLAAIIQTDRRRWPLALTGAFGSYWLCYAVWAHSLRGPLPTGLLFLGVTCAFLLFFAWIPWWTVVRREPARGQDLIVLALNGAAYFGASYLLLNPQYHAWLGLFAVTLAGVHLGLGAKLWRVRVAAGQDLPPVLLTLGVALSFLTLAAPIQFTAYRITMAWALEAAALTWIGVRIKENRLIIGAVIVFALTYARLVTIDAWIYPTPSGHAAVWNQRFLTFALTAICLWLSAYWIRPTPLALAEYIAAHVVLLWTLTQEVLEWAARSHPAQSLLSTETISITILYALYAVVLISIGVAARSTIDRITGLALIGFVVLKLYLFDVWQLSRLHCTLAFVALGVLLLSTSFMYSHFRALIESWWKNDEART